jgi:hypothetical protein
VAAATQLSVIAKINFAMRNISDLQNYCKSAGASSAAILRTPTPHNLAALAQNVFDGSSTANAKLLLSLIIDSHHEQQGPPTA